MVKNNSFMLLTMVVLFGLFLAGCGSPPKATADPAPVVPLPRATAPAPAPVAAQPPAPAVGPDELDTAVRETSDYLNKQLPKGNKLVVLNIQSEFPALSEYIIDELIANTVNDRIFSVVDRQQLNTIRAELDFQMSGEVDDSTAQALGRMAGAQIIISGAVSRIGDLYRMRIRALNVQSAQIDGQFNRNIPNGLTISALVGSKATGYGGDSQGSTVRSTSTAGPVVPAQSAPAQTVQSIPVQVAPPNPPPAAPAEPAVVYKVGDKGPAGGFVFYDLGYYMDGWRYLEAAPRDVGPAEWGPYGSTVNGTNTGVGSGKANTQRIVFQLQQKELSGRAAQFCTAMNINGYTGWFLPSKEELNLMYINLKLKGLGGFNNGYYWSSSEGRYDHEALAQKFSDGSQNNDNRTKSHLVRAARAF